MTSGRDDTLLVIMAGELEMLSRRVEALGARLAGDLGVALQHFTALQGLDVVAQTQTELASILRLLSSGTASDAIGRVRLEALAAKLSAPVDGAYE